ncbi:endo-1,4-beta-xylanase [candidate division KSB1 bacterium]|nr:endo-1,4-beta-xylanase [candidate division KSB1 bacterium]
MMFFRSKQRSKLLVPIAFVLLCGTASAQTVPVQTDVPALKDVYKNDFKIGCLLSYAHVGFATDPYVPGQSGVVASTGGDLIKYHMNSMSPGNWMKSTYIVDINGSAAAYRAAATQAEKDSIDVHPIVTFNGNIIAQLNWAQRQGFTFRGHTLVWHNQNPGPTFFRSGYTTNGTRLTKEQMTERMENFIGEVFRIIHEGWPGLLSAMDVVNEAVNEDGTDRTENNEWYTTFGDNSFVMKAFEFSRKYTELYGEAQIKLYYNDYNTQNPSKADGIVRICTPIYEAGFLDGIGMQDHDSNNSPTAAQWIATYNKFEPICDEMAVTELDVTTGSASPSSYTLDLQANQYGQLFKCFVERSYYSGRGKIINVSKDGLNDEWTFKKNQSSSLWDADNQCKPSFYAVVDVGLNYNKLDSLIASADTLNEAKYTVESWTDFVTALAAAEDALSKNYSTTVSAADALKDAVEDLTAAIDGMVKNATSVKIVNGRSPRAFALDQNYPNPFNPVTNIKFTLPEEHEINLVVYDIMGKVVKQLVSGRYPAGSYNVAFDASNLSSGVYLYSLTAGDFLSVKKLTVTK